MNPEISDIRWIQRFDNYCRALNQLTKFMEKGELNELEEQGLIQAFEYNHELAWKTLKDFLESRSSMKFYGSKDVSREAFKLGLLGESEHAGVMWLDMIEKCKAMKPTKFGLGFTIIDSIQAVFSAHPEVDEVVLYGSRAKGNYKVGSDIDLTMKGEAVDFDVLSMISQELYDLPIPYMVGLSIFTHINNDNLIEHINRVCKMFYSKTPEEV
ncbi:MAG: nucleotidyltransferase substrate binding protein [Mariprofundaceae bacterium]|nr:nucleotidyltransferase substrate binding protein [Mariprofundaceae bacterium]